MSEISPLHILEAALFASTTPMPIDKLTKLFSEEKKIKANQVKKWLEELQAQYQERGIHLVEVASGYRFQVAPEVAPFLSSNTEEKPAKFSRALMETLALIAYRQPITRGEIEEIRGVVVSTNIVKTLDELGWVRIVGYKDVPGKPALYATSKAFLDYFNLKSLDELPPLVELKELDVIEQMVENAPENGIVEEEQSEIAQGADAEVDETSSKIENVENESAAEVETINTDSELTDEETESSHLEIADEDTVIADLELTDEETEFLENFEENDASY